MFGHIRQELDEFREPPHGERFIARHHRHKQSHPVTRVVMMLIGLVLMVVGVALLVLPGPGLIIIVVGLALASGELKFVSRFLDWGDVKINGWWNSWKMRGKQIDPPDDSIVDVEVDPDADS